MENSFKRLFCAKRAVNEHVMRSQLSQGDPSLVENPISHPPAQTPFGTTTFVLAHVVGLNFSEKRGILLPRVRLATPGG